MKTLINQLKFGTLLTGLIFLSSCMGDATSENNQMAGLIKHPENPNQIMTALPISFETADAILISN